MLAIGGLRTGGITPLRRTGSDELKPGRCSLRSLLTATLLSIVATGATICNGLADERATLDIAHYTETFSEEFDAIAVTAWGPIVPGQSRWIAHTPWAGDFGDAAFADPTPGFPFSVANGVLRIEAKKDETGNWSSGLLSSADGQGNGFAQAMGYFEMRAKLPGGPGVWPAFWLMYNQDPDFSAEIDVMEHYGVAPDKYESVTHVWPKSEKVKPSGDLMRHDVPHMSLSSDFHTYGVLIEDDWMVFFLDRSEVSRTKTLPEFKRPMFVLVNLALGSGWPIDQTPNPSHMFVDYVKVYKSKISSSVTAR